MASQIRIQKQKPVRRQEPDPPVNPVTGKPMKF